MFRKNVLKSLTMFVFTFLMFTGLAMNSYAAETWVGHEIMRLGDSIETTGSWKASGTKVYIQGNIIEDENGRKVYEGFDPESTIEIGFEGTGFKLIGASWWGQAAEYRIMIDDVVDESFEIESEGYAGNQELFKVEGLENTKHRVRITPVRYFGEKFGGKYAEQYTYVISSAYAKGNFIPVDEAPQFGVINPGENVVLDVEPQEEKIGLDEEVVADLTIDNIEKIAAEDIRIKFDSARLEYLGYEEVEGIKLIKDIQNHDELRVILASQGEANIINDKKVLLKLKFRGTMTGKALVKVIKGRVTDGIEMERDLEDSDCGRGAILIEEAEIFIDVNNSGEFTLLDLGIDARHFGKDPSSQELEIYNTDVVEDGAIDDADLLEIGNQMLQNGNYIPNNY
ncbi:hypothetical protein WG909_02490 [Peptostreptococcaceae bacterium AGR-M142]